MIPALTFECALAESGILRRKTPFTMTARQTSVLIVAISPLMLSMGCNNNCAGVGLARVLPETATIAVGQQFLPEYQEGDSCRGGNISDADYHATPSRWSTQDTTVVRVDSLTGLITGRRVGDARVSVHSAAGLALLVRVR